MDNLTSLVKDPVQTGKAILAGLSDFAGFTMNGVPGSKLLGFADGGVISRPTMLVDMQSGQPYAQMAEKGFPEAIVPLSGGRGGSSSTSSAPNISIGTVINNHPQDLNQFAKELTFRLSLGS
jgi:hypothetical protein